MIQAVKWLGLLSPLLESGVAKSDKVQGLGQIWNAIVQVFGQMIKALSINGQIGIGIILFTILVRTLLLPLFQVQMKSSRKMQELQPQLRKLQEEYAGTDTESRTILYEKTQQLYKDNGVKLSAAVLPLFLQMPILLALFHALTTIDALKVGTFLWVNLGEKDPYFILPILAGLLTFASMWLNNQAMEEQQPGMKFMSYAMSAMIFFFALTAASGVALYWTVSNAYQVAQTLLLNNPFKIKAERQASQAAEKAYQAKIRRAQKKARKKK